MRIQNILSVWIIFVTGCGGGGSGPTPEPPAISSNNKPVFSSSSTFSVRENETSIGTVTATDADGDTVSYSISGTDASSVSIDSSTGTLSFISAPDYEAIQSYSVTALVSDGSDEASQNISITILNIDPPSIDKMFFSENANGGLSEEIILSQSEHIFSSRTTNNGSVDQLVASFGYTGISVSIGDTIQESGSTVNDFTDIVTYSVTNSDGDVEEYTVDLMRFTGLPIIYLKTDDAVAIDSKEDYVQGDTSLDGGRDFDNLDDLEMKIRGRGNSTWGLHPKKPFQMKLSDKAEFLGMPNDKKWLFLDHLPTSPCKGNL